MPPSRHQRRHINPRPQPYTRPEVVDLVEDFGYDSVSTLLDSDDEGAKVSTSNKDPEDDPEFFDLHNYHTAAGTLKIGKCVELNTGDFFKVTSLLQNRKSNAVILRGLRFRRAVYLDGLFERKSNEIIQLFTQIKDSAGNTTRQHIVTIDPLQVIRLRKIIMTNQHFPQHSWTQSQDLRRMGDLWIRVFGPLVCRWRSIQNDPYCSSLERLHIEDCDEGAGATDDLLRYTFRGRTTKGGSSARITREEIVFSHQERCRVSHHDPLGFDSITATRTIGQIIDLTVDHGHTDHQRYTFGDTFCGCGGVSRGAKGAGLRVEWGVDNTFAAIRSYALNFTGANCWQANVYDISTTMTENFRVDILHLSPPCQPYSWAHTRPGIWDEMNQATFFAIYQLIQKVKPRIVTLEETDGLIKIGEHKPWFRTLIHNFTSLGYNVRWQVCNLADYGVPARRRRLVVIASCPGEPLPEFPQPTHCDPRQLHVYPNRHPWNTVNQVISDIPPGTSFHSPQPMNHIQKPPYDGNQIFRNTICCGGKVWHPSGRRPLTLREIALIQGFPLEHEFDRGFPDTAIRKQIGNAVPPIFAKALFDTIVAHLKKVDGVAT